MRTVGRAVLWYLLAAVSANVVWGLYGSLIWPLQVGQGFEVAWLGWRFVGTVYWSAALSVMISPVYVAGLTLWLIFERRKAVLYTSRAGMILGAFSLALPFALAVAHFNVSPAWVDDRVYWKEFLLAFPSVMVAAFAGLFAGRILLNVIEQRLWPGLRSRRSEARLE